MFIEVFPVLQKEQMFTLVFRVLQEVHMFIEVFPVLQKEQMWSPYCSVCCRRNTLVAGEGKSSTSVSINEYKYTVNIGDQHIRITGRYQLYTLPTQKWLNLVHK